MAAHQVDEVTHAIAAYAYNPLPRSEEAFKTARLCLADSLGCAILSLQFPACVKLLGPIVPGATLENGARVPGTQHVLDPVRAAFNIGTMVRWLDFNDTWLAAEWGHPSDNLGGLLAAADYLDRNGKELHIQDLLEAMIKAHEIQGVIALENSFNRIGFDHVILVKIATAAVTTALLGGTIEHIENAVSNAWLDTGPLRTYRHAPNTGSRKSWAAGDQTSRGLFLALTALRGEMGYPNALTAKNWGLYDVLFKGRPFKFSRSFGSYVMENVLFKIAFPAEFHAQTAVEAALQLYPKIKGKWDEIDRIVIETHESAIRIIDKRGPLCNPADRDHCLQYMVAIPLLFGELDAEHYEEEVSNDKRIDQLRDKMVVVENLDYSLDYMDPDKRSIANKLTIHLTNGEILGPVQVEYPLGHRSRREEGTPLLFDKFEKNMHTHYDAAKVQELSSLFRDGKHLEELRVSAFMDLLL